VDYYRQYIFAFRLVLFLPTGSYRLSYSTFAVPQPVQLELVLIANELSNFKLKTLQSYYAKSMKLGNERV